MAFRLTILEIFVLETALWLGLWLYDDYLASLLTIIVGVIVFFVLVIALISEWLEPSRVPKWYFQIMAASLAALLLAAGIYLLLFGANTGISKEI